MKIFILFLEKKNYEASDKSCLPKKKGGVGRNAIEL